MFIICQGLHWVSTLHKLLSLIVTVLWKNMIILILQMDKAWRGCLTGPRWCSWWVGRAGTQTQGSRGSGADLPPADWSVHTSFSIVAYRTLSLGSSSTSFWSFRFPTWQRLKVGSWGLSVSSWQRWLSRYHIPAAWPWLCTCWATAPFCYNTVHTQEQD